MVEVIRILSVKTHGKAAIVADVGQHQMEAARYYSFSQTDGYITSGGSGTMGFALPAAFGAKVGAPDREVVAIIGDGCFQMTLQELGTIWQSELPVRSEEHTSEIQSLMRISYADFCLKKNKKQI